MRIWFKPKRFWNIFAAYYPVSGEGWAVLLLALAAVVWQFRVVDAASHSASDTLLNFVPRAAVIFVIFDIISRMTGAYPSWWRERGAHAGAVKMLLWALVIITALVMILLLLRGNSAL